MNNDRGSTIPLILGFFLLALTMIAGAVAAGDAFVQQRGLQDVCDGAAAAAAASAADLSRASDVGRGDAARFTDVARAVSGYQQRDPSRAEVRITASVSGDGRTLTLSCVETRKIAFGAMFGKGDGVRHAATSSARAPLS
ncbi:MAG: pilus assembly protein TadG-related protein [Jatrophihabitantaceae bacterium]